MNAIYNSAIGAGQCETHGVYTSGSCFACWPSLSREAYLREIDKVRQFERAQQKQQVAEIIINQQIPLRYRHLSLADWCSETAMQQKTLQLLQRYVKALAQQKFLGLSLLLTGENAFTLTGLGYALTRALMGQGITTQFVTAKHCVRQIKQSYSKTTVMTEQSVLTSFLQAEVLIIDRIYSPLAQQSFLSDKEKHLLNEVLEQRYEASLATVVLATCDKKTFSHYLGSVALACLTQPGAVLVWDEAGALKKPVQMKLVVNEH